MRDKPCHGLTREALSPTLGHEDKSQLSVFPVNQSLDPAYGLIVESSLYDEWNVTSAAIPIGSRRFNI